MQFIYKNWSNLFNEKNFRRWLGIEDYSKPFMAAMFIVELEIPSPMVGTGFLWGAWVFSFGPPFMSHLLPFHYVGSLSSRLK